MSILVWQGDVLLIEHNATSSAVGKPSLQLRNAGWDCASGTSTSSSACSEALWLANNSVGSSLLKLRTVANSSSVGSSECATECKSRESHVDSGDDVWNEWMLDGWMWNEWIPSNKQHIDVIYIVELMLLRK